MKNKNNKNLTVTIKAKVIVMVTITITVVTVTIPITIEKMQVFLRVCYLIQIEKFELSHCEIKPIKLRCLL